MNIVKVTTEDELKDAFTIRKIVFIEEQQVPEEEEIDQYEDAADHFVLYDDNKPIGAGRFRVVDGKGKVERICILSSYRGKGAGKIIMEAIEQHASEQGLTRLKLNAQTHAIPFYEKLKYEVVSDEFLDAGIPHKTMEKSL
ncbi:acetyltransferase [Heyndrickxia shackletonii]|uniref:Acetyltransferase n=1 Tax=Heyndrickxia shackletonii TaxID=157838 RepID=A0A0Q3TLT8_9BACI|nr:GNAT family N-acetyltransferase [Heyndrickxia shackletonii]KQL54958.1 acetyltransferase [Heyndrickxia shackletonii]NEZ01331.1 GNAT family N-acetyltransferase [Heyndrickxia shackletonii]